VVFSGALAAMGEPKQRSDLIEGKANVPAPPNEG
jgi:hypothetical protein